MLFRSVIIIVLVGIIFIPDLQSSTTAPSSRSLAQQHRQAQEHEERSEQLQNHPPLPTPPTTQANAAGMSHMS